MGTDSSDRQFHWIIKCNVSTGAFYHCTAVIKLIVYIASHVPSTWVTCTQVVPRVYGLSNVNRTYMYAVASSIRSHKCWSRLALSLLRSITVYYGVYLGTGNTLAGSGNLRKRWIFEQFGTVFSHSNRTVMLFAYTYIVQAAGNPNSTLRVHI